MRGRGAEGRVRVYLVAGSQQTLQTARSARPVANLHAMDFIARAISGERSEILRSDRHRVWSVDGDGAAQCKFRSGYRRARGRECVGRLAGSR